MMSRKVFAALCLAALAALCSGELYVVEFKPIPCEYEMQSTTTSPSGEETSITKNHGSFLFESNSEGITLARPDISTEPNGDVFTVYVSNMEDECNTGLSNHMGEIGTMAFEHKDADTLNGKECFKYYNSTDDVIFWADADNNPLAMENPEEEEGARTRNIIVIPATPYTRETFVLPQGYKCSENSMVFEAPSEEAYAAACPAPIPEPSSSGNGDSSFTHTSSSMGAAGMHGLSALAVLCAFVAALLLL